MARAVECRAKTVSPCMTWRPLTPHLVGVLSPCEGMSLATTERSARLVQEGQKHACSGIPAYGMTAAGQGGRVGRLGGSHEVVLLFENKCLEKCLAALFLSTL